MDAGSWMEAFERASERLVEDWQVKLVTTGLLAEGVFPFELISLFALACCRDACCYYDAPSGVDLGCEPPTEAQVEALAMFCARAVEELGLSVADIYTHAEMAAFDGYGIGSGDPDMRWDLLYVPDYGDGGRLVPGGELIRGKTKYYRKQRSGLLCL